MSNVRWEPIRGDWHIDGVVDIHTLMPGWIEYNDDGYEAWLEVEQIIALPPDIRLCRAVAPQWSQEQPTDCDRFWVWRPKWKRPLGAYVRPHSYDPMDLVLVMENGLRVPLSEMEHDTWYMPAPVPPPPKGTDNASSR